MGWGCAGGGVGCGKAGPHGCWLDVLILWELSRVELTVVNRCSLDPMPLPVGKNPKEGPGEE